MLDFFRLKDKYPVLTDKDISFLNAFFNHEAIISRFMDLENVRKKRLFVTAIICIIADMMIILLSKEKYPESIFAIILRFIVADYMIFFFIGFFFRNISKELKQKVMSVLAGKIDANLRYSGGDDYSFDEKIFIRKGMLKQYDRLDKKEDSIEYDYALSKDRFGIPAGGFKINGYEFKSSDKRRSSKGKTRYVTNNHAYLTKITFNDPLHAIDKEIILKKDRSDNRLYILFVSASITAAIGILVFYASGLAFRGASGSTALGYGITQWNYVTFWIIIMAAIFMLVHNRVINHMNKERVRMENLDFEKRFDVFCEDQIASRKILTPAFMYRLVDFSKKNGKSGDHEFYFHKNEIYIKRDLMNRGGYMEISLFKNILENAEQLILFYVELKNSASLAKDLGLEYFDKEAMNKVIID